MFANVLEAQDAAIIIGACAALVVSILGPLLKVIVDIRRQTTETAIAVNHTPPGEVTLRELVVQIMSKVDEIDDISTQRHDSNVRRIDRLTIAVDQTVRKVDRVQDAVGGINARMEQYERERQLRDDPEGDHEDS